MPTGGKTTLTQFLIETRRRHPDATGEMNAVITDVALACKAISRKVQFGALAGVLGSAGSQNVQGEEQKALDVLANQMFIRSNEWGGHVAGPACSGSRRSGRTAIPARTRQRSRAQSARAFRKGETDTSCISATPRCRTS